MTYTAEYSNRRIKSILYYCLCIVVFSNTTSLEAKISSKQNVDWVTDYNAGLKLAKDQDKNILLLFSGSDWSPTSVQLRKNVLLDKSFANKLAKNCVCVDLDCSKDALLDEQSVHSSLINQFQVKEFPSLVILDNANREIAKIDSIDLDKKNLLVLIFKILNQHKLLQDVVYQLENNKHEITEAQLTEWYKVAQDLRRLDIINNIFDIANSIELTDHFLLLEQYRAALNEESNDKINLIKAKIQSINIEKPENTAFTIALLEFQKALDKEFPVVESYKAVQPLEQYLEKYKDANKEYTWKIEMTLAQFFMNMDCWSIALEHAQQASAFAPNTMKEDIEKSVDYIRFFSSLERGC